MFCTNCGKELPDNSKFCSFCGSVIKSPTEASVSVKSIVNEPEEAPKAMEPVVQNGAQGQGQPMSQQPAKEEPEGLQTVDVQPKFQQPGEEKPVNQQPEIEQPESQSMSAQPENQPMPGQPMYQQPMSGQPMYQQPMPTQPVNKNINADNRMPNPANAKQPVHKKKKTKIILIVAGILVGLLLIGGTAGFFVYQNHIMKQAVNVVALFDEKDYGKALDLYEKYSGKKEAFNENVNVELKERAELVKGDYLAEKIDYNTAIGQLQAITDFKDDELTEKTTEITQWINMINDSRTNYVEAKSLYDAGDFEGALEKYELVVEEDTFYYTLASEDMAMAEEAIQAEEQRRLEEERINNLRDEVLSNAEDYEYLNDYSSAISVIEEGLVEIPADEILTEKLTYYQGLSDMATKVMDITSSTYEHTYQDNNIDLFDVSIVLPVLSGVSPAYEKINQVFDELLTGYISSNDSWAEDIKLYYMDENFYTNSLELAYTVQYNNNGLLSISVDGYSYTGGAHGYPIRSVYTFDLATGEQLALSDLIAVSESEFWPYVSTEFQNLMNQNPTIYWEDAMTTVENAGMSFSTMNYYLLEDGICFYFYPYDLASYADGFIEVVLPFAGNEWMFNFLE